MPHQETAVQWKRLYATYRAQFQAPYTASIAGVIAISGIMHYFARVPQPLYTLAE